MRSPRHLSIALLSFGALACGGEDPGPTGPPIDNLPILSVELDAMAEHRPSDRILEAASAAFREAGLNVQFFRDEEEIPSITFDGSAEQRHRLLSEHRDDLNSVHVVMATRRIDFPGRGGELVTARGDAIDASGILIYLDELADLHPACGRPGSEVIEVGDAIAGTLIHEIGHALQLGHDTDVGGGINYYNIMSVPEGCTEAQMRFHGENNDDPSLGATEEVGAPRFSRAAIDRMDLENVVSIHVATLIEEHGREM